MAGLKTVGRKLVPAARRIAAPNTDRDHDRRRNAENESRAWYKTKGWYRLRWSTLQRAELVCAICKRQDDGLAAMRGIWAGLPEATKAELFRTAMAERSGDWVADHIRPHRGDAALFWDEGNVQCLCAPCHNSAKQKEERAGGGYARRPEWLRPSAIPLTIVCGPPCAGKSTWVAARAVQGDVVIDLDAIVAEVSGQPFSHDWDRFDWTGPAMRRRNAMLADLARAKAGRAWFVLAAPKAEDREWWAAQLGAVAVVVMPVPLEVCRARVLDDPGRNAGATMRGVAAWWSEYRARAQDIIAV